MVTIDSVKPSLNAKGEYRGKNVIEGSCLSTDTKPTNYANGSKLLESDTSTLFVFDEANNLWRAW